MVNRKHSKVTKLDPEIRKTVHTLIVEGVTIEKIVEHLTELAGQGVIDPEDVPSKSSVGRYSQGFLSQLQRLDLARQQAKVIVERAQGDGLVMEEAAANLILNEIMKILLPENGKAIKPKVVGSIAMAISKITSSSASRERAKIDVYNDMKKRTRDAAKQIGSMAKKGGLSKQAVDEIKSKILGIAS